MLKRRQGLDSGGQSAAGDQRVLAHLRVMAGMGRLSVDRHLKAVPAPEAHRHIIVAALAHNGVIGVNHILRHQLIAALAQPLLVRHEAGENLAPESVSMSGIVGQGL